MTTITHLYCPLNEPRLITIDLSLDIKGHELTVRVEYEEPRKMKVDNGGFRFVGGILRFDQATFRTDPIDYDIVGVWSERLKRYVKVIADNKGDRTLSVGIERAIEAKLTGGKE